MAEETKALESMEKAELVAYAMQTYGAELSMKDNKAALLQACKDLDAAAAAANTSSPAADSAPAESKNVEPAATAGGTSGAGSPPTEEPPPVLGDTGSGKRTDPRAIAGDGYQNPRS